MRRVAILLFLFVCLTVQADTEFFTSISFSGTAQNNFSGGLGARITPTVDNLSITKLGRRCFTGDSATHVITLYDNDNNVLGSVTVNMAGHSAGDIVEATLSSAVAVISGNHYFIQSTESNGGDSWGLKEDLTVSHTTDFTIDGSAFFLGGANTFNNDGADLIYVPPTFSYTSGGGGSCTGLTPQNLTVDPGSTMSGTNLPTSLTWSNTCDTSPVNVYFATNGSTYSLYNQKNAGSIHSDSINVGQNQIWDFKVGYAGETVYSSTVHVWGIQAPSTTAVSVISTNSVLISFNSNAGTNATGHLIEQSTNSDFSNSIFFSVDATNSVLTLHTITYVYAFNTVYFWRAYSTNAAGGITSPSTSASAAPNALPPPFAYFNAAVRPNHDVFINWGLNAGLTTEILIQASVSDTSHFATIFAVPVGPSTDDRTDSSQTVGTTVFYRLVATNVVGQTISLTNKVIISPDVSASTFFISPAGNGQGGTNWATAWPNWSSIGWNSVQPGSTIWVTNANYDEIVTLPDASGNWQGGTANLPVTFRYWTNNPAGVVRLTAFVNQHVASIGYIHVDGHRWDNFTYNTANLSAFTNNVGIQFRGNTNVNAAVFVNALGMQFLWVEAMGDYANQSSRGEGATCLFEIVGGVATDCKLKYIWGHDANADFYSGCDGLDLLNYTQTDTNAAPGLIEVGPWIFERLSDNFISGSFSYVAFHDGINRDWIPVVGGNEPANGHPDGMQGGCFRTGMTNVATYNVDGYGFYIEANDAITRDVFLVNCSTYATSDTNKPRAAFQVSTEPQITAGMSIILSNMVVDHCTFYGLAGGYFGIARRDTNTDGTLQCTNLAVKSLWLQNNLIQNVAAVAQFGATVNVTERGSDSGRIDILDPSQVHIANNNSWGTNSFINFNSTNFAVGSVGTSNFTYAPTFNSLSTFDFRPTQTDATNMVGLGGALRDAYGFLRSTFGNAVGAFTVPVDTDLVMMPAYEVFNGINNVPDATPFGNDADLPGISTINFPIATNCPGGFAGAWINDCHYLGNTNLNQLSNMTNGTFMVRGRITAGIFGDSVFVDAGSTGTNGWAFGRDDSTPIRFWVVTDNGNKSNLCAFSDVITDDTGFRSFGVTWACSGSTLTGVGYSNGIPFVTNTVSGVSRLTVAENNGWLGVGCRKHFGTFTPYDDESASPSCNGTNGSALHSYPNNGFENGPQADFRIYRRTLTAAEVLAVFNGQGTSGGGGSAPTINSFMATPSVITSGQSSVLAWSTTNADSLFIDHGVGDVTGLTQTTVSPTSTTTYTLTASNVVGTVTAPASIIVSAPAPVVNSENARIHGSLKISGSLKIQ